MDWDGPTFLETVWFELRWLESVEADRLKGENLEVEREAIIHSG